MAQTSNLKASRGAARAISVGDRVFMENGGSVTPLLVIEDRGYIGFGGRRLLRVEVLDKDLAEVSRFEIAEDDVLRRRPRQAPARRPAKTR